MHDYIRDGAEIYRRSFAIIRAEADLARFSPAEERVAVRIIHACGMVEIARDIVMAPDFADNARWALVAGAPILCDSKMVANGITRARLPAANEVVCTLDDPEGARARAPHRQHPQRRGDGAVGRAAGRRGGRDRQRADRAVSPARDARCRRQPPAAVIGLPVGFVGAAESKEALAADGRVPFLIVQGPQGRQRHGRGGGQCAGERGRMTSLDESGRHARAAARSTASASARATCAISPCARPGWCARSTSSPSSPSAASRAMRGASWRRC